MSLCCTTWVCDNCIYRVPRSGLFHVWGRQYVKSLRPVGVPAETANMLLSEMVDGSPANRDRRKSTEKLIQNFTKTTLLVIWELQGWCTSNTSCALPAWEANVTPRIGVGVAEYILTMMVVIMVERVSPNQGTTTTRGRILH